MPGKWDDISNFAGIEVTMHRERVFLRIRFFAWEERLQGSVSIPRWSETWPKRRDKNRRELGASTAISSLLVSRWMEGAAMQSRRWRRPDKDEVEDFVSRVYDGEGSRGEGSHGNNYETLAP